MRLTPRLIACGDAVIGLIRDPGQADDIRAQGAEPVVCDLEHASASEIASAIDGSDAVLDAVLREPLATDRILYVTGGPDPIEHALTAALR